MKKFLIASGVAVMAFATVAAAQSFTFTANLTVGSTGAEVTALQTFLLGKGYVIPALSTGVASKGYFGSQTKAAVMKFQAANGVPNTGFVGPLTRAALNAGGVMIGGGVPCPAGVTCTPNPVTFVCPVGYSCVKDGTTTTGGTLAGTDGTISDVTELSQYSNEDIGEGENDVKVLGLEVEASNDGDIALKSIKLSIDTSGNSGSDNLDDYIDGVSVWLGTMKVGSADVSAFNEDSNGHYSKTITLKSGTIVKADDTQKLYVAVDAVSNLDSGDIGGDNTTFTVDSIRYEDGSGVVSTETSTGDLPVSVGVNFVTFSTSADTELKISTDSSNPEANIIVVDDTDNTDNVVLLVGKMKVDGTSDITIDELPITFTTDASGGLAAVTGSVTLKFSTGETFSESISTSSVSASTTFDNLNYKIAAGKTVTFTVLADINDIDTGFAEGKGITVSLTSSNRNLIDAENEQGDQLSDSSEKSGTALGNSQEFRTSGIGLKLIGTPTAVVSDGATANTDSGTFIIKFSITAFGDTAYIASSSYQAYKGGVATSSDSISGVIENDTDTTEETNGTWAIEDGDTENFTMTVSIPLGGANPGLYQVFLTGIGWDTSDVTVSTKQYTSELDSFKTPYITLN